MEKIKEEIPNHNDNKLRAKLDFVDDENKGINIVVVLGSSWEDFKEGEHPELSTDSKLRTLAAGVLASEKDISQLIFAGGRTAGPENPSEAQEMKRYLKENFSNLEVSIKLDSESFDTIENAKFVNEIAGKTDLSKVFVVTNEYHRERVSAIFEYVGMPVEVVAAEDVLRRTYQKDKGENYYPYKKFIEQHLNSGEIKRKEFLEVGLRVINKLDPEGRLLTSLAKKLRHAEE